MQKIIFFVTISPKTANTATTQLGSCPKGTVSVCYVHVRFSVQSSSDDALNMCVFRLSSGPADLPTFAAAYYPRTSRTAVNLLNESVGKSNIVP